MPFDHVPAADLNEPRDALAAFAKKWAALAAAGAKGVSWKGSPHIPGDLAELSKQLARQAQLLALWADDDELWDFDD